MSKILIIYESKTGETNLIGQFIAEKLNDSGIEVNFKKLKNIKEEINIEGYDALILGSDTICGDMAKEIKSFLALADKFDLNGKIGGAFGTFGCSGEGPKRIYETMKNNLEMNMVNGPLIIASENTSISIKIQKAYNYANDIIEKLNAM